MFLTPILPKFSINNNFSPAQNKVPAQNIKPQYKNQLNADTVCFTAKVDKKSTPKINNKDSTYTIGEVMKADYEATKIYYQVIGRRFMANLSDIADELQEFGVSFDKKYCEQNFIKSTDSYFSKLRRCGQVADPIRATLFVENPYDLKAFNDKILPALKNHGYEIKPLNKKGDPDLDIRLANISEKQRKQLDPIYQNCISKPQCSGYEDIQMRLIDTTLPKNKRPPMELLVVFGKQYAEAKHNESYYVYDITRSLKDLLHVAKIKDPKLHTPEKRIQDNIGMIRTTLNSSLSTALFHNAKQIDFEHEEPTLPEKLSNIDQLKLKGLMEGIREKTEFYYKDKIKKINSKDYDSEIIKQIKRTEEYQLRENKEITPAEIKAKKTALKANYQKMRDEDLTIISEANRRLDETFEKYGEKPPKVSTAKSNTEAEVETKEEI